MSTGILGYKVGMTHIFDEAGNRVPVSLIKAGPVTVIQKKTRLKDGYEALQLGFDPAVSKKGKSKKVNSPRKGHFPDGIQPTRVLREFPADPNQEVEVGQTFDVSMFEKSQKVDISGVSKGRGFSGVMKRHNFGGGPGGHGHRRMLRSTGSIGQSATPGRVFKNKKMAGQYGNTRVTVGGLEIVDVRTDMNLLVVKGGIPGPNGRLVEIRRSVKNP